MGLCVKGEHEYLGVTGKSFAQKSQAQNPVLRPTRELFYDKCFVFESGAMPSGRRTKFFQNSATWAFFVAEIGTIFDGGWRRFFA